MFTWWQALCAGISQVTGEFPSQRPVTRSFDDFFGLGLNKRLRKQQRRWWFETPLRSLWRHRIVVSHWILTRATDRDVYHISGWLDNSKFTITSSHGTIFPVTGPLWGESTGHRWIPLIRDQWGGTLMFFISIFARTKGWNRWVVDAFRCKTFMWRHCNVIISRLRDFVSSGGNTSDRLVH